MKFAFARVYHSWGELFSTFSFADVRWAFVLCFWEEDLSKITPVIVQGFNWLQLQFDPEAQVITSRLGFFALFSSASFQGCPQPLAGLPPDRKLSAAAPSLTWPNPVVDRKHCFPGIPENIWSELMTQLRLCTLLWNNCSGEGSSAHAPDSGDGANHSQPQNWVGRMASQGEIYQEKRD